MDKFDDLSTVVAPAPQPITVFFGPTLTKHDELRLIERPGKVYVGRWTVYSSGKETQRAGMWLSTEEAKALRNSLEALTAH